MSLAIFMALAGFSADVTVPVAVAGVWALLAGTLIVHVDRI